MVALTQIFANPQGFLEGFLLNPGGISALWSIVPLIILYLVRPRPKKKIIPSLMFLLKDHTSFNINSFFRRFSRDWLFLIQLLILILISLAIAKPFIEVSKDMFVKNQVIVLDVSASMQTKLPEGGTRFDKAMGIAKTTLEGKNTIILISNVPQVILENKGSGEAGKALDSVKVKDTGSNIYDAIMLASQYASQKESKVTVISDFIDTTNPEGYLTAKKVLESKGVTVDYQDVSSNANNIGIIALDFNEDNTIAWIKNYYSIDQTFTVKIGTEEKKLTIKSQDVEPFGFIIKQGVDKITLDVKDDLGVDNSVDISTVRDDKIKVLYLTNNRNNYLYTALSLQKNLQIEVVEPPKVPEINHKVIILDNINKDMILPGTIRKIKEAVENGATVIILANDNMFNMGYLDMLPVKYKGPAGGQTTINKVIDNTFTKDVVFGSAKKYLKVESTEIAGTMAVADDNSTILALSKFGKGKVFYYGIIDSESDFKFDTYYPIFWKRLIDVLADVQGLDTLNLKTGTIISLAKTQKVKTPQGTDNTQIVRMDKKGIYEIGEKAISANLLNDQESNIMKRKINSDSLQLDLITGEEKKKQELTDYLIIGAIIFIFIELLYVKFRGDI